jgi:lipopolysaccharide export system protein LptA
MNLKSKVLIGAALLGTTLALAAGSRVITITAQNRSGGPSATAWEYTGTVKGKVQTLEIAAEKASLSASEGGPVSNAEGKRVANFTGAVVVTRGRMTSKGVSLEYKEATGLGLLAGPVNVVQKAEKKDGDDVTITASKATFDVDTNVSTSEGNVKLINGRQTATSSKVVYDEDSTLGCLSDSRTVTLVREPKNKGDNRLVITALDVRVNTDANTLIASGGVKLEAGDNVTTGEALYYDDAKDTAWVIGNVAKKIPAKNVNRKNGSTVTAGTIINYTKKNQTEQLGTPFKVPLEKFTCPSSK